MASWLSLESVPVVAHQGGWDEMALVAVPLLVVAAGLWLANRRVSSQIAPPPDGPGDTNQSDPRPT